MRQGIVEYLQGRQMNVGSMDLNITNVQFNGNQADATVSFTAKGGDPSAGMQIQYKLELRNGKWAVVSHQDVGAPHGSSGPPGMAVPSGAPAAGGQNPHGGAMPAPENLPPAGKK